MIDNNNTITYKSKQYKTSEFKDAKPMFPLSSIQEFSEEIHAEFPIDLLGDVIGDAAKAIQEEKRVPFILPGQSFLAAVSALAQPFVNFKMGSIECPSSLFLLTIAESGDRKTSVDKVVLKPIKDFEEKIRLEYAQKMAETTNTDPPLLILHESTYDGLVIRFKTSSSIWLFSSEGANFFGGYAMNEENVQRTISGFSEIWDGASITRSRVYEKMLKLFGRRLGVHLMIQPIIAKKHLMDELLKSQGFLARFLLGSVRPQTEPRPYNDTDIYNDPRIKKYFEHVNKILEINFPIDDKDAVKLQPRLISPSQEAKKTWIDFYNRIEETIIEDGIYRDIKPFACKAAEMAGRIALSLAFFENPDLTEISNDWMERACKLMDFYLKETDRLWNTPPEDPNLKLAEKYLWWIKKNSEHDIFRVLDICKSISKKIRKKNLVLTGLSILESYGYLRRHKLENETFLIVQPPSDVSLN